MLDLKPAASASLTPVALAKVVRRNIRPEIVLALLLIWAGAARADVIDRIMAVVSGQPITLSDVTAARQFGLVQVPPGTPDPIAFTLDRLIERRLILAEVERFQPPEPDPVEMTIRVDELERQAGSPAAFEKALAIVGMTHDQLRRHFRDDLRITTYLNQRFGATTAEAERQAAIKTWTSELRRRAAVTVLAPAR